MLILIGSRMASHKRSLYVPPPLLVLRVVGKRGLLIFWLLLGTHCSGAEETQAVRYFNLTAAFYRFVRSISMYSILYLYSFPWGSFSLLQYIKIFVLTLPIG